jgi:phosphoglycerate dehydrogenase-like enzyme
VTYTGCPGQLQPGADGPDSIAVVATRARAVYIDTASADRHEGPALLAEAGFEVSDHVALTPREVVRAATGATAVLLGDSPFPREVVAALPGLGIVSTVTAGIDQVDLDAAREHGLCVANTPGAVSEEVAVTALALALSLIRHLPFLDRHVREGGWDAFSTGPRRRPSTLTLGVVGLGRTGRRLAEIAQPVFGSVIGADPAPAAEPPAGAERVPLDELLRRADVVSLHVPAERGAPPLLDAAAIARMRPGSYLVNVARGALVDTGALLAALDDGRLAGAGLDVSNPEPPPADHPLRSHPRVVLTPHSAFYSHEAEAEACAHQAGNVVAWSRTGRPLTPVVEGRAR